MQLIDNNVEQFKESKAPITRNEGYWIESNIFFNAFDNFIVLYNPCYSLKDTHLKLLNSKLSETYNNSYISFFIIPVIISDSNFK